jgi:hypothetical protein
MSSAEARAAAADWLGEIGCRLQTREERKRIRPRYLLSIQHDYVSAGDVRRVVVACDPAATRVPMQRSGRSKDAASRRHPAE